MARTQAFSGLAILLLTCLSGTLIAQPRIIVFPHELGPYIDEFNEEAVNICNEGDEPLEFQIEIDQGPQIWIAVEPEEGRLEGQSDTDIFVEVNLEGLLAGEYVGTIHILNNDPDDQDVPVMVTAEVESIPLINVLWDENIGYPDLIDWNQAFPDEPLYTGETYTIPVTIQSDGNDILQVFEIRSINRFFTSYPDHLNIEPVSRQEVEFSFSAAVSGHQETEMVIISNAANQAEMRIPLSADAVAPPVFEVPLSAGWNMISAPVISLQRDIRVLFASLAENGSLLLVKDETGCFYSPAHDFNNIPFWDHLQGYMVNMSQDDQFTIIGRPVPPDEPIPLDEGWNIAAYLPEAEVRPTVAFWNIMDELFLAKDIHGNFFFPEREFNNIPPLQRGHGYLVKVNHDLNMVWYYLSPAQIELEFDDQRYQRGGFETWQVGVDVNVLDDGGNLVNGDILVDFNVEPDDVQVEPVQTHNGTAETWLTFSTELTLQPVTITAVVEAVDGRVEQQFEYILPLLEGLINLQVEPGIWEFDRERPEDMCSIRIMAELTDGYRTPVNDAVVNFRVNRGNLYWFDRQEEDFIVFQDEVGRMITGLQDDRHEEEPGCATAFLRGVMADFFLDPFTLEVIMQINVSLEDFDIEAEPFFIPFWRE